MGECYRPGDRPKSTLEGREKQREKEAEDGEVVSGLVNLGLKRYSAFSVDFE